MWMSKEVRLERIKDLKQCVKKSPIAMAYGLAFSVIGVLISLLAPHFFWTPYLSLGVFVVVIPVAIKLNRLNKKHTIWLEENENLITVLDSISPTFVHQDGEAGFFCVAIDPCCLNTSGPNKLTVAFQRLQVIQSSWGSKQKAMIEAALESEKKRTK